MRRKTFVKINRGLFTAKHERIMGVRIFLFGYMLDRANWETGIVSGWRDQDAADHFEKPLSTIRHRRRKLEEDGYIRCQRTLHGLNIQIQNYQDPRHSDNHSDNYSDNHSGNHTDNHPYTRINTPTSNSDIRYQMSEEELGGTGPVFKTWEKIRGAITPFDVDELRAQLDDWAIHLSKLPEGHPDRGRKPADVVVLALEETGKRADTPNLKYADTILQRWKREGVQNQRKKKDGRSEMQAYIEQKKKEMQL